MLAARQLDAVIDMAAAVTPIFNDALDEDFTSAELLSEARELCAFDPDLFRANRALRRRVAASTRR